MHCPYCKSRDTWRLDPYPWMARIRPRMRNRRCSVCGHEFAVWCHRFYFKHHTARQIVFLFQVVIWVLIVCFAVDIYRMSQNPSTSLLYQGYEFFRALFTSH